jgi:opacity protein-like surface antigen
MKRFLLAAGLAAVALSCPAQTVTWRVKAAGLVTLPHIQEMPEFPVVIGGNTYYVLQDHDEFTTPLRPGGLAGVAAQWRSAGRWGAGVELLAAYEPLYLRRRPALRPGALTRSEEVRTYRYSLGKLQLPLYATYTGGPWQLRLGAAPSLLLDRQVRITEPGLVLVNGQPVPTTNKQSRTDESLRTVNWRLLLGLQYELSPTTALELSLMPALTNLYRFRNASEFIVFRDIRAHALSLGVSYALGPRQL